MKITVVGRGNIGGGLAKRWERAGHEVNALGRDGGDGSDADVVVVAVPSSSVADALAKVTGIEGKPTIDTINAFHGRTRTSSRSRTRSSRSSGDRRRSRSTSTSRG